LEADDDDFEASRYTFLASRVSSLKYLSSYSVDIVTAGATAAQGQRLGQHYTEPNVGSIHAWRRAHAPVERMVPAADVGVGVVEEGSAVAVDVGLPGEYWAGGCGGKGGGTCQGRGTGARRAASGIQRRDGYLQS